MRAGRDQGIDCARGLAMVLVVLGHSPAFAGLSPASVAWIFTFHVAAFFFISGALLRPDRFDVAQVARRILGPFVVVGLLLGAVKCLWRGDDPVTALLGLIWGTGATVPTSQLWFLPALFVAMLLAAVLVRGGVRPDRPQIFAVVLVALLPLAWLALRLPAPDMAAPLRRPGNSGPLGWVWSVDLLPLATFFILAGYGAAQADWLSRLRGWMAWPALGVVTLCFLMGARTDMNMRLVQDFPLAILAGLAGCLAVWSVGRSIARAPGLSPAMALIGRHSMMILAFHVMAQNAAIAVVTRLVGVQPAGLVIATLIGLGAGVILPLILSLGVDLVAARSARRTATRGA